MAVTGRRGFLGIMGGAAVAAPAMAERVSDSMRNAMPPPTMPYPPEPTGMMQESVRYIPKLTDLASYRNIDTLREIVRTGKLPDNLKFRGRGGLNRELGGPGGIREPWASMRLPEHTKWRMQEAWYERRAEQEYVEAARRRLETLDKLMRGEGDLSKLVHRSSFIEDLFHRAESVRENAPDDWP